MVESVSICCSRINTVEFCKILNGILSNSLFRLCYKLDILMTFKVSKPHITLLLTELKFWILCSNVKTFLKVFYLKTKSDIQLHILINLFVLFVIRVPFEMFPCQNRLIHH